ncbi:ATP-binding protein [Cetobacterium sp.]|uniref:ATP-binding protein n=1 Tax=Cetobacterium sp. TaxID=2071632 RepID=UPI003EE74420
MLNSIGIIKKVFPLKIVIEIYDLNQLNQNYRGDVYRCNGIDDYIIVHKSLQEKYLYQITGLYEEEKPLNKEAESKFISTAYFEATPIGSLINKRFEYGLSSYPLFGTEVYMVSEDIFNCIFKTKGVHNIRLGSLTNKPEFYPSINIDSLFSSHISILGNTGSGKSTTVRKLIDEVDRMVKKNKIKKENVNFFIFDVHNEYNNIGENSKTIEIDDISIPTKLLSLDDWLNLVMPSTLTQLPLVICALRLGNLIENNVLGQNSDKIIFAFCALALYKNQQTDAVGKRTKILSFLENVDDKRINEAAKKYNSQFGNLSLNDEKEFKSSIESYLEANNQAGFNYFTLNQHLEKCEYSINSLYNLQTYIELALCLEESKGNNQLRSHCSNLQIRIQNLITNYGGNLFSDNEGKKQNFENFINHNEVSFLILNCSFLENEDLNFLVSFILNQIYLRAKNNNCNRQLYNFIFDEAHKYISEKQSLNEYNSIKTFEKISREGRKFGIFMIVASQRAAELSKTVLSQCNNFILHRIRNNVDLEQIRKSIPYISDSQIYRISFLKTGNALVVGEAFKIPLELCIEEVENESSATVLATNTWNE